MIGHCIVNSTPPFQSLELALLGLLRGESRHAYELFQIVQSTEALGLVWRLKQGNLYAVLAKLESAGCIASRLESQGARPPRKMLQLTARGEEVFTEWLASPVEHGRDFRLEFLAKLYFTAQTGHETAGVLITPQRGACRE